MFFLGDLTFASLPSGAGRTWQLSSPQLSVNGKTTALLKRTRDIIFDSGTSNVLFDTDTTEVCPVLGCSLLCYWYCEPRPFTPSSRPTSNQTRPNLGLMVLHVTRSPPYPQSSTSHSPRKPGSPSTLRSRAVNWVSALLQITHHCVKHSSMRLTASNWSVGVYWSTTIASGISVVNGWALLRTVRTIYHNVWCSSLKTIRTRILIFHLLNRYRSYPRKFAASLATLNFQLICNIWDLPKTTHQCIARVSLACLLNIIRLATLRRIDRWSSGRWHQHTPINASKSFLSFKTPSFYV